MAFIKLLPSKERGALPVNDVIRRLEDKFAIVNADPEEGQDQVAGMIAYILRLDDDFPGKDEQIARLQSFQDRAVWVSFGDDLDPAAATCVMPDSDLFFGGRDEVDGPARPLVERAASALGYTLHAG